MLRNRGVKFRHVSLATDFY